MGKYYLVEKVKNCFMIDAFNKNIIKQKNGKLEMLSSKVIKPAEIGVKLNKKRKMYCADKDYKIKEISEKEVNKLLWEAAKNYSLWQGYMFNAEDRGSPHLTGPTREVLY